jgi:hypothetical protein
VPGTVFRTGVNVTQYVYNAAGLVQDVIDPMGIDERTLERSWRWRRRNSLAAGLALSVTALLLLIALGASLAALRLSRELARIENAERSAAQEKEAANDHLWKGSLAPRPRASPERLHGSALREPQGH